MKRRRTWRELDVHRRACFMDIRKWKQMREEGTKMTVGWWRTDGRGRDEDSGRAVEDTLPNTYKIQYIRSSSIF